MPIIKGWNYTTFKIKDYADFKGRNYVVRVDDEVGRNITDLVETAVKNIHPDEVDGMFANCLILWRHGKSAIS